MLELPAKEEVLEAALAEYDGLGSDGAAWERIAWDGLDCVVPKLTGISFDYGSENSCNESSTRLLNDLARNLAAMEFEDMTAYKALLEAVDCRSLDAAVKLLDTLSDYILFRQISVPSDIAEMRLRKVARGQRAEALIPCVDMEHYGEALMEESGGELTSYGLLIRKDGQPVAGFKEQPDQRGISTQMHFYWDLKSYGRFPRETAAPSGKGRKGKTQNTCTSRHQSTKLSGHCSASILIQRPTRVCVSALMRCRKRWRRR